MRKRRYRRVVNVLRTDVAAYNPNRPISDLIRHQVDALSRMEQDLPAEMRSGIDPKTLTTEHHASSYIGHAAARVLHYALGNRKPADKPARRRARRPKPAKHAPKGTSRARGARARRK